MANLIKLIFKNYADDAVRAMGTGTKAGKFTKMFKKSGPSIHTDYGDMLKMQATKSRAIKVDSVPTQQYLDDMLGIGKYTKADQLARYKDVKAAFSGKTPQQVVTTSKKTIDVVDDLNNVKLIDSLKTSEVTGELTGAVKNRRLEILEAFETYELPPNAWKPNFLQKITTPISNRFCRFLEKYHPPKEVPGSHVPDWARTGKWANKCYW